MADESTSVGKVQLDIEISQSSLNREMNKLGSVFNSSFKNMFSQTTNFAKNSLDRMTNSFKTFSQVGTGSTDKVSKNINKMKSDLEKAQSKIKETNDKLAQLYAEQDNIMQSYRGMPAFTGMSSQESLEQMLSSDTSYTSLASEIESLEGRLQELTTASDTTRNSIRDLEGNLSNANKATEKASNRMKQATNNTRKLGREIKKTGQSAKVSTGKVVGFASMIDSTFRRILRRMFIYNLIYKGIRGIVNYTGAALKTNQEFAHSLNLIKTNLMVAFQPIYDYILPAINALMRGLATATTYIASAMSALFGKTYQQSFGAAKGLDNAKKAMDGYGKAAKKAQGQLAGFDEINQLDLSKDDEQGGAGGFEMAMADTSVIDLTGFEKFRDMLQPTIDSLKNLGLVLEPLKNFAAQGLKDFYNNFLIPVGQWTFGEGLPRFIDAITRGLMGVNWQPINDGLNNLWLALTPFTINVGEGLLWFWENVLVPLSTWTINNVVPVFLDILAEAIKVLNVVIEALKPLGLWLWNNFLKPLAEWTGGIIVGALEGIKEGLKGIGDWINDNQETVEVFLGIFTTWKATTFVLEMGKATFAVIAHTKATIVSKFETLILMGLYAKDAIARGLSTVATWGQVAATTAWNIVAGIATTVTTALGAAIAFLTSPIGIVIAAIVALIAIGVLLYKNWDEVSVWLKNLWEGIKIKATEVFGSVKTFVTNTTSAIGTNIDKFAKSFKATWDKIWNGAKAVFDNMWNSLTGIVKGVINGIIGIINKFIGFWNSIQLSVPAVEIPLVGKVGGFSIGVPKIPNIPMLARGGIVDQPTLAMVGERGKEAVVPLENTAFVDTLASALGNAVMSAMQMGSGGGGSGIDSNGDVILQIDGATLGRILGPILDKEKQRIGNNVVIQPI